MIQDYVELLLPVPPHSYLISTVINPGNNTKVNQRRKVVKIGKSYFGSRTGELVEQQVVSYFPVQQDGYLLLDLHYKNKH